VKTLEVKTKLVSTALFAGLITLAGAMLMMWFAIALAEISPSAPGIAAFVLGGTYVIYRATMSVYNAYINVLATEDLAD
jgi:hypothetical protein